MYYIDISEIPDEIYTRSENPRRVFNRKGATWFRVNKIKYEIVFHKVETTRIITPRTGAFPYERCYEMNEAVGIQFYTAEDAMAFRLAWMDN